MELKDQRTNMIRSVSDCGKLGGTEARQDVFDYFNRDHALLYRVVSE